MPRKKKSGSAAWVDPDDAPPLTNAFFDRAETRNGDTVIRCGRPPLTSPKQAVKLRLDADVLAAYRKTGDGWQTRINADLRKASKLKASERMDEIGKILKKYDAAREGDELNLDSLKGINRFALTFYKDVAEIYDCLTRIKNVKRNATGFSLDDAPILGLLVRVWKLLKEIIKYYEQDNAEIIAILERPLIEASVTATYLMTKDRNVIEDYRKCSYKDRLRLLRDLENGSPFYETKAGKRLLKSVREKMEFEKLTTEDFDLQKKNRWRIQGKSFYDIFSEVDRADLYAATYGMMSESIHGSWHESMEWCLARKEDGTFSAYPFHFPADIRFVTPTIKFANKPFRLWLQRIDAYDENFRNLLDWVESVNTMLFKQFDDKYDG